MATTISEQIRGLVVSSTHTKAAITDAIAGKDQKRRNSVTSILSQMIRRDEARLRNDGIVIPNIDYPAIPPRGRPRKNTARNTKPTGTAIARAHKPPKPQRAAEHTDTRTQHARDLARDLVANVEDATESLITMIDQICEDHPDLALAVRMQRRAVSMLRAGHALAEA